MLGRRRSAGLGNRISKAGYRDERGMGLTEIILALIVFAIVGAVLYGYMGSTGKALETLKDRPLASVRLAADRQILAVIRNALQIYYSQNGHWPPSKKAVAALVVPEPRFQCAGNDFTYDPVSGQVRLVVDDVSRC